MVRQNPTLMDTPKSHPYGYTKIPPLWIRQNPTFMGTPKSHPYGTPKSHLNGVPLRVGEGWDFGVPGWDFGKIEGWENGKVGN